ncbi:MAG: hypothetical protein ACI94Y_001560 [Maribacter sp.]|jgi:uncharacterized protein (DUF1697 family)
MNQYISLLRGINVSGKNKIKMAELRAMYKKLDFHAVESYIQSGNVKFESSEENTQILAIIITEAIKKEFGYDVNILVVDSHQIHQIASNNPFLQDRHEDIKFLHVTLIKQLPNDELVKTIKDVQPKDDEFIIRRNTIYVFTPGGYGKTKLSNAFFERKLKVSATTRNWKTILKLKSMLE